MSVLHNNNNVIDFGLFKLEAKKSGSLFTLVSGWFLVVFNKSFDLKNDSVSIRHMGSLKLIPFFTRTWKFVGHEMVYIHMN